jgi:hypothetical protein
MIVSCIYLEVVETEVNEVGSSERGGLILFKIYTGLACLATSMGFIRILSTSALRTPE